MPTLISRLTTNKAQTLVRTLLNQSTWGTKALQMSIVQPAHHIGPVRRLWKWNCSQELPPYQAMKNSIE